MTSLLGLVIICLHCAPAILHFHFPERTDTVAVTVKPGETFKFHCVSHLELKAPRYLKINCLNADAGECETSQFGIDYKLKISLSYIQSFTITPGVVNVFLVSFFFNSSLNGTRFGCDGDGLDTLLISDSCMPQNLYY